MLGLFVGLAGGSFSVGSAYVARWFSKARQGFAMGIFGAGNSGAALLAACFSLPGGVLRAFGGWLSDRFGAHPVTWWVMLISWVCLFFMAYPQTDLIVKTARGDPGGSAIRLGRATSN